MLRRECALRGAGHEVLLVARHTDEESMQRLYGLRSAIKVVTGTTGSTICPSLSRGSPNSCVSRGGPRSSWRGRTRRPGRRFGLEWEVEGEIVNHVFRWNRKTVDQVAKSYLGPNSFTNASFNLWHHNVRLEALARRAGWESETAVARLAYLKKAADRLWPSGGNQFCGMVIKA